jgi:hypothetical protein
MPSAGQIFAHTFYIQFYENLRLYTPFCVALAVPLVQGALSIVFWHTYSNLDDAGKTLNQVYHIDGNFLDPQYLIQFFIWRTVVQIERYTIGCVWRIIIWISRTIGLSMLLSSFWQFLCDETVIGPIWNYIVLFFILFWRFISLIFLGLVRLGLIMAFGTLVFQFVSSVWVIINLLPEVRKILAPSSDPVASEGTRKSR